LGGAQGGCPLGTALGWIQIRLTMSRYYLAQSRILPPYNFDPVREEEHKKIIV